MRVSENEAYSTMRVFGFRNCAVEVCGRASHLRLADLL